MENPKQEVKQKKTVERSSAYPAIDLEEAIVLVDKIKKSFGSGPYSRLAAVNGMGYATVTGSSAPKVAALVHYGLFIRNNDTYNLSPLAERILVEVSAEDKQLAIKEALYNPKLFKNLIERYQGSSLPTLLKNILYREYGIMEKIAPEVVKTFQKSVEFAGVMKNGVILSREDINDASRARTDEKSFDNSEGLNEKSILPKDTLNTVDFQRSEIILSHGRAVIFLPSKMTSKDVERLKGLIEIFANVISEEEGEI